MHFVVGEVLKGARRTFGVAQKGEHVIAKTTGHKSRCALRRYIQTGQLFRENAAPTLGL